MLLIFYYRIWCNTINFNTGKCAINMTVCKHIQLIRGKCIHTIYLHDKKKLSIHKLNSTFGIRFIFYQNAEWNELLLIQDYSNYFKLFVFDSLAKFGNFKYKSSTSILNYIIFKNRTSIIIFCYNVERSNYKTMQFYCFNRQK